MIISCIEHFEGLKKLLKELTFKKNSFKHYLNFFNAALSDRSYYM